MSSIKRGAPWLALGSLLIVSGLMSVVLAATQRSWLWGGVSVFLSLAGLLVGARGLLGVARSASTNLDGRITELRNTDRRLGAALHDGERAVRRVDARCDSLEAQVEEGRHRHTEELDELRFQLSQLGKSLEATEAKVVKHRALIYRALDESGTHAAAIRSVKSTQDELTVRAEKQRALIYRALRESERQRVSLKKVTAKQRSLDDRIGKQRALIYRALEAAENRGPSTSAKDGAVVDEAARLREAFASAPSARNLGRLLKQLWDVEGEISRPSALVRQYPQLVGLFGKTSSRMADDIRDAADVLGEPPRIPPRSKGALTMPEPGRVLYCVHATPEFHSNGYAIRTKGIAEGLAMNGKHVRVVGRPGYPWDVRGVAHPPRERQTRHVETPEWPGSVEYVHLPSLGLDDLPRGIYVQAAVDALVREAMEFRPEVIHAASNSQNALIALIAARRLGLPFVYEVRGFWEITKGAASEGWEGSERFDQDVALETLVLSEADAVAAITRQLADECVRRGADADRVTVVPNAVDVEAWQPIPRDVNYEPVDGLGDSTLVGFAGSLVPYEGLGLLVEAVGRLRAEGIDCQAVIAGSGSDERALKDQVAKAGLSEVVHFLGRVPHDQIKLLLARLDIVACPRVSNSVTEMVSPLKPLEAFAAGRVVVMSDVAPQRDLAQEGVLAPLFEADDAGALAEELRKLILDADVRRDYERRSRLWVCDERTWVRVAGRFDGIYEQAGVFRAGTLDDGRDPTMEDVRVGAIGDIGDLAGRVGELKRLDGSAGLTDQGIDLLDVDVVVIEAGVIPADSLRRVMMLCGTAAARRVPVLLLADMAQALSPQTEQLLPFVDHVLSPRGCEPRARSLLGARTGTGFSSMPHFPPTMTAEDGDAIRSNHVSVLSDSIPPERVLDVARAHGLRIHATSAAVVPERFRDHVEFVDELDAAIADAAASTVTLRRADAGDMGVETALAGLGGVSVHVREREDLDALDATISRLGRDLEERARRGWEAFRTVHRGVTHDTVWVGALRAAGVRVDSRHHPPYAVEIHDPSPSVISELMGQTVPPTRINGQDPAELHPGPDPSGPRPGDDATPAAEVMFRGEFRPGLPRTYFEDLLAAAEATGASTIHVEQGQGPDHGIVVKGESDAALGLTRVAADKEHEDRSSAVVYLPAERGEIRPDPGASEEATSPEPSVVVHQPYRLLVAGHDLKFLTPVLDSFETAGITLDFDHWTSHSGHDEAASRQKLEVADGIFCEWGLGNAVWYSQNKRRTQNLVVRVHSQEIRTAYLSRVRHASVDRYVFVSDLVRRTAVLGHGVPAEKSIVIPNGVDIGRLRRPKIHGSEKTIGFVGSVPKTKRLDLALDVLEGILERDDAFRLIVKGRSAFDYPWMVAREQEISWYRDQYARAGSINAAHGDAVRFEGHGDDMPEWYSKIGIVLSTSDFESFHYTIADGAASGAAPVVLHWPGAEFLYPREWLVGSVPEAVDAVLDARPKAADAEWIARQFGMDEVAHEMTALIVAMARKDGSLDD